MWSFFWHDLKPALYLHDVLVQYFTILLLGLPACTAHRCLTHLLQLMSSLVEFLMAWMGHVRLVKHLKWAALRRPQEQNLKTLFSGPEWMTFIGLPTSFSFWCQRILTQDVGQVAIRVSEWVVTLFGQCITQGRPNLLLERHCPAEFSANSNTLAWKFLVGLKSPINWIKWD